MKNQFFFTTLAFLLASSVVSCQPNSKEFILKTVGQKEYGILMSLSMDKFDQSPLGFRQYTHNVELTSHLISEYIMVNKLSPEQSRNLHWHMGQIYAFDDNYEDAIKEMEQAYAGGTKYWECYVSGSIAFLKKDKKAIEDALATLRLQENQMNIEFLEKFIKYFDQSYFDAYNADL